MLEQEDQNVYYVSGTRAWKEKAIIEELFNEDYTNRASATTVGSAEHIYVGILRS